MRAPHNRMVRSTVVLVILLLALVGEVLAEEGHSFLLSTSITDKGAELLLWRGIGRQQYQPSGIEGKVQEYYAKKEFQGRQFMYVNPGDWCFLFLRVPDGDAVVIDGATRIGLVLEDGTQVTSDIILTLDHPLEYRYFDARYTTLFFRNGLSPYARTLSGLYPLYVRFPERSCLTDKGDEHERRFRAAPASLTFYRTDTKGSDENDDGTDR